jgi:uncharacterized protein YegP (UPF0339 family)
MTTEPDIPFSEEELAALVDEAERGYDPDELIARRGDARIPPLRSRQRPAMFQIYRDADMRYRYRLMLRARVVLQSTEGFATKEEAMASIEAVRDDVLRAQIEMWG